MFFGGPGGYPSSTAQAPITPIASSVVIKSLNDLQSQLATEIDAHVLAHPAPGPKSKEVSNELVQAWGRFPRSCEWYGRLITRLADRASSVDAEQAVAELVLQWLPPSIGASGPGSAFQRSQFDFSKFTKRLTCVQVASAFAGSNRKELQAKQDEQNRNTELVQIVVSITVCDVLAALLHPRPGRLGTPIDPDIGHICVQLAFGQFNPNSERAAMAATMLQATFAAPLHQRTVISWSHVISHLARSRFDQIVNEFIQRVHGVKSACLILESALDSPLHTPACPQILPCSRAPSRSQTRRKSSTSWWACSA